MDDFNDIQMFYNWIVSALEDQIFYAIHESITFAVQCHDYKKLQEIYDFSKKLEVELG